MYEYKARVERIVDGDTIVLSCDLGFGIWRKSEPYRLLRINAPELHFKSGKAAKQFLIETLAVKGMDCHVTTEKSDVYGRYLAEVELEDGTNLSTYMVEHNHAKFKVY